MSIIILGVQFVVNSVENIQSQMVKETKHIFVVGTCSQFAK